MTTTRQGKGNARRARMSNAAPGMAKAKKLAKVSTGTRLRYRFDNAMARGPMVVVLYLAIVSVLIMFVAALIAVVADLSFGGEVSGSFGERLWQAMLRTVDAGSFAADTAWPTRIVGFVVTIAGIFIAGSLIGLIANAVDQQVEELRKGRSTVVEARHTLILGWSEQVPRIIGELVLANESERDAVVVVLSSTDKTEMEETLRDRIDDMKTTRVVCRSGSTSSPADLQRSALGQARSIIIVRGDDGDAGVVKAILAVKAVDPELDDTHIVAELTQSDTSRILREATGGLVLTVSSDQVVAEVTAQACLQAGLSSVFTDLLDFGGDEIYFTPAGALAGKTYAEALVSYEAASVIGRMTSAGAVELNPLPDAVLAGSDQLIVVAEDDSTIAGAAASAYTAPAPTGPGVGAGESLEVVLVGWSSFGHRVLRELDEFLPENSRVTVVIDGDLVDRSELESITIANATLDVIVGDGGPADFVALADGRPKRVIVLGYRDVLSVDDADARTLVTLLALRAQWPANGDHGVRIVAELLDQRNLELATPVGVDDLIVSNALASLLMAQLSEHPALLAVFDDLFDAEGAVIEMRDAAALVPATPMPYGNVVAAGAAAGVSVFGYRLAATGHVVMNPRKSETVTLGAGDAAIVIAVA